ncbi:MAG: DeoR/GlpR transcriptional regulator [Cytophagales bacterium]|nr:DeoR/GlpR transcriptional regulator [Cytophagales bacterium]
MGHLALPHGGLGAFCYMELFFELRPSTDTFDPMTQRQRLQAILDLLQQREELSVDQACALLDASPATVRRDFNLLTADGEVEKTWGGVARKRHVESDMKPLLYRQSHLVAEKKAIAQKAAELVQNGDVVMIDGGTTTVELIPALTSKKIRIITNSLLIANAMHLHRKGWEGMELFVTGGFLYPDSGLLVGPEANRNLQQYHADWGFLSAGGLDENGVTNSNQLVVETERTMMAQSERSVILADHSKLGLRSMCKMCDYSEFHLLYTNQLTSPLHDIIRQAGVEVVLV